MNAATPSAETAAPGGGLWVRIVGLGLVAGVLSGLFGVGGGFLIGPGLVFIAKMDQRRANGTSLAAIVPIAAAALVQYTRDGSVSWEIAAILLFGSLIGTEIGTRLLERVPRRTLQYLFAAVLILAAARLALDPSDPISTPELALLAGLELAVLGLATGVLSGLLGVGGGFVMVPGMLMIAETTSALARGTSLAVILPTGVFGTVRNLPRGNVDLRVAAVVGAVGAVAATASGGLGVAVDPVIANVAFGSLLVGIAVRLIATARQPDPADEQLVAS